MKSLKPLFLTISFLLDAKNEKQYEKNVEQNFTNIKQTWMFVWEWTKSQKK